MKKLLFFTSSVLLFSCSPKATKEQSAAYDSCKKTILDNQRLFLAGAPNKEKADSLQNYLDDLQQCNLNQLISKYDVPPEEVNEMVYSVCEKAEAVKKLKSLEDELQRTDSTINVLDKMMQDSTK